LIFPITVLVVLGILLLSLLLARWNADRLSKAMLSSVSGNVRFDRDSSGKSGIITYFVIIGKKKFKFGDDMSDIFEEGHKYKFYYCKAGLYEFVMSYEKLQ
jgi:hypothetical protein